MEEGEHQPQVPVCSTCQDGDRSVTYSVHPVRYGEFKRSAAYRPPDLVLVQNAGFSEFHDAPDVPGWAEGWSEVVELLPPAPALLVFTAYTRGEADKDLARFTKYCDPEILAAAQPNPMRSLRPCRDWEQDGNQDVFYSNQFFSVVRTKSPE